VAFFLKYIVRYHNLFNKSHTEKYWEVYLSWFSKGTEPMQTVRFRNIEIYYETCIDLQNYGEQTVPQCTICKLESQKGW
jgi:hypothetical protein